MKFSDIALGRARVRAVRDFESTLQYLFLPALNQREDKLKKKKKKKLLYVLFFCLWAATASKRKKGGRKERSQREKGRASLVCPKGFLTAPT